MPRDRDLADRGEDRADLRREVALTARIVIVTARTVDRQHVEDRRVDFAESRGDRPVALRAERIQREIALRRTIIVGVGAGRVDCLVEDRSADRDPQITARQASERFADRELRLIQIRRIVGDVLGRQVIAHRLAVLPGIDEVVAAVGDDIEQVLDVHIPVGLATQVGVHRGRIELIVDIVQDRPGNAEGRPVDAATGGVRRDGVRQRADEASDLALGGERVVGVQRAVGRSAIHARRADIDRQCQDVRARGERRRLGLRRRILREKDAGRRVGADRGRTARVVRRRLLEVDQQIGLGIVADLRGEPCRTAEALDIRRRPRRTGWSMSTWQTVLGAVALTAVANCAAVGL